MIPTNLRSLKAEPRRIILLGYAPVSDGCLLRILEGLMTLKLCGADRERLSYRTLDFEEIGSVFETVLAVKAGKNNKTPVSLWMSFVGT